MLNIADDNDDEINDSREEMEAEPTVQVKTYSDAIDSMEVVMKFLEDKGHTDEATYASSLISLIVKKSLVPTCSSL